jgi:hypothetical protein
MSKCFIRISVTCVLSTYILLPTLGLLISPTEKHVASPRSWSKLVQTPVKNHPNIDLHSFHFLYRPSALFNFTARHSNYHEWYKIPNPSHFAQLCSPVALKHRYVPLPFAPPLFRTTASLPPPSTIYSSTKVLSPTRPLVFQSTPLHTDTIRLVFPPQFQMLPHSFPPPSYSVFNALSHGVVGIPPSRLLSAPLKQTPFISPLLHHPLACPL